MSTCYLLHFTAPIGNLDNPRGQAQHYIGCTDDLENRLHEHATGQGARITQVFAEKGIAFILARTWTGTWHKERALKAKKHASRFCPICQGK